MKTMKLLEFYDCVVDITGNDGRSAIGKVEDYIYPEDNENGKESIIVNFPDGTAQEFYEEYIERIIVI